MPHFVLYPMESSGVNWLIEIHRISCVEVGHIQCSIRSLSTRNTAMNLAHFRSTARKMFDNTAHVGTFVALFALIDIQPIHDIFRSKDPMAVHTVLTFTKGHSHVTIIYYFQNGWYIRYSCCLC